LIPTEKTIIAARRTVTVNGQYHTGIGNRSPGSNVVVWRKYAATQPEIPTRSRRNAVGNQHATHLDLFSQNISTGIPRKIKSANLGK
jgi:hypothetical protein